MPTKTTFDDVIESKALAVTDAAEPERPVSSVPATLADVDDFEFTADELSLPLLRIAQGLSKEVQDGLARQGQLLVRGHAAMDDCTFVPFRVQRIRQYRDREENGKLACYSDDRVEGHGDPGGSCEECPLSKWTKAVDKKTGREYNAAPACSEGYRYYGVVAEVGTMVQWELTRSQAVVAKDINTIIQNNRKRWGQFALKVRSKQKENAQGNRFAVPVVEEVKVDEDVLVAAQACLV